MSLMRSFERKVLYKCLPVSEAYMYDMDNDCRKLIPKKILYDKFPKIKRFDSLLYDAAIKFFGNLDYSSIDLLKNISNPVYLNNRYENFESDFRFKCFPPSYFYYLHGKGMTKNEHDILTFFNRRFNSNSLDEYVYDLMEPS